MKKINQKDLDTKMEDAVIKLYSYIKIADAYIQNHVEVPEILHLGLIIDNMEEVIDTVIPHYCSLFDEE